MCIRRHTFSMHTACTVLQVNGARAKKCVVRARLPVRGARAVALDPVGLCVCVCMCATLCRVRVPR